MAREGANPPYDARGADQASRYSFDDGERWVYAARFPNEVPLVNGELEWIAATLE